MKPATINELKKELEFRSHTQLLEYCMAMARFKLESKELLSYLVFESENETASILSVKSFIDINFEEITATNFYFIKKRIRKILRQIKRFIRYSKKKETEAELLLYFCKVLITFEPSILKNKMLTNMYHRQLELALKAISKLHEDLQFDYNVMIEELEELY